MISPILGHVSLPTLSVFIGAVVVVVVAVATLASWMIRRGGEHPPPPALPPSMASMEWANRDPAPDPGRVSPSAFRLFGLRSPSDIVGVVALVLLPLASASRISASCDADDGTVSTVSVGGGARTVFMC